MQGYNIVVVFDKRRERVLLCRRRKEPYKGLLNFVGDKIEPGEEGLAAAYRELREETGLTEADISLFHFMDFTYYLHAPCRLEVYAGRLKGPAQARGEENQLIWQDAKEDMFDRTRFAGMGNMGHIMALLEQEDL